MVRIGTVTTKVRPIRKLFVLDDGDLPGFLSVVKAVSTELVGLSNLILLRNGQLLSDSTAEFVGYHDPDVVVNLSSEGDADLRRRFGLPTFSVEPGDLVFRRLMTRLSMVDHVLDFLKPYWESEDREVFACFTGTDSLEGVTYALNFGMADQELVEALEHSLLAGLHVNSLESVEQLLALASVDEANFLKASLPLANVSHGSSVWTVDRNPEEYFVDKPTVVVGAPGSLESMAYFWNMRATQPDNCTTWLPGDIVRAIPDCLREYSHCCLFTDDEEIGRLVKASGVSVIDHSMYYFRGFTQQWEWYASTQNVSVVDERVRVSHPANRMLSSLGFNIGFAFDVSGLREFWTPSASGMGDLYYPPPEHGFDRWHFARVRKGTLSVYGSILNVFEDDPLVEDIQLPEADAVIRARFADHGLNITETIATRASDQVIALVGGDDGIGSLTERPVFNLLVKLTPPRTEKLARSLARLTGGDHEAIVQVLRASGLRPSAAINSDVVLDLDEMLSSIATSKTDREPMCKAIEVLYDKRILLRGKSFTCPHCNQRLWYPLESLQDENKCYGCSREVSIPVSAGGRSRGDHFRLNELVANAVDQGQLPLLLTRHMLSLLPFTMKRFLSSYDVSDADSGERTAEVDLVFTLSSLLGLAEVKADRGFEEEQTGRLIDLAMRVGADMLLFATLKSRDSQEVAALVEQLRVRSLAIPAFVATGDVLFSRESVDLGRYFWIDPRSSRRPSGPIVI